MRRRDVPCNVLLQLYSQEVTENYDEEQLPAELVSYKERKIKLKVPTDTKAKRVFRRHFCNSQKRSFSFETKLSPIF